MSNFLKSFALFIPFCVGVYLVLLCLAGTILPIGATPNLVYSTEKISGNTFSRLQEADSIQNTELLIVGSSHAYRGFDTRNFDSLGIKTFNIGTSAQTPQQTLVVLNKYLDKIKPKKIIFEVNPDIFSNDGVGASLDLIANANLNSDFTKTCIETKNIKVINTLLFAAFKKYIIGSPKTKESRKGEKETYIQGGYVERKIVYFHKKKPIIDKTSLKAEQLEAFAKIIKVFQEKNIDYVLVQSPITQAMYKGYSTAPQFDSIVREKGKYLDFNKIISLNDSLDFYDQQHMNPSGVRIFNKSLIDTLLATHFLVKK